MKIDTKKTCCGNIIRAEKDNGVFKLWCPNCDKRGKGTTIEEAERLFDTSKPGTAPTQTVKPSPVTKELAVISRTNLPTYIADHAKDLADISAPFIRSDRPAFAMMVKKNMRYAQSLTGTAYDKTWTTKEGQESWLVAIEDAMMLGATMPEMGCIVPFGEVVEFIPDVEAYKFAVTTGKSSPFEWFDIDIIYENDQYRTGRKNGNFFIEFTSISANRGQPIAIVPYGKLKNGRTVGEVYEVPRLLEKAKAHSPSYRNYALDLMAFEAAKVEGKVKSENGREYIEVEREYYNKEKRQKEKYNKKIYKDELANPYDGPDKPEMLRKVAGKSFLWPYIKTRNSTAAINELSETDDVSSLLDGALNAALDSMPTEPEMKSANIDDIVDAATSGDSKGGYESLFGED